MYRKGLPDIGEVVKNVFEKELELNIEDQFLRIDDIEEILRDEPEIWDDEPRKNIFGYPTRPLYRELGARLQEWMLTGACPSKALPKYFMLDEVEENWKRNEVIKKISEKITSIGSLHSLWSYDQLTYSIHSLLKMLGKPGILNLLGMRNTFGSKKFFAPPKKALIASFNESNTEGSMLTVGGRALSKHFHRDESSSWWGSCRGTDADKNNYAEKKMLEIVEHATWINIHQIAGRVLIVEIRQENGYGVRWTNDGKQFRGFLEPQMKNGHEVGWRH